MRKNILFIDSAGTFGGSLKSFHSLLNNLDQNKYNPIVITNKFNPDNYILENQIHGVTYIPFKLYTPFTHSTWFDYVRKINQQIATFGRISYWGTFGVMRDVVRFIRICRKHKIDLIHSINGLSCNCAPALTAKILKLPYISHHRGPFVEPYADFLHVARKNVDHSITVSHDIRRTLLSAGMPADRVTTVWNGGDIVSDEIPLVDLNKEFGTENIKYYGIAGRIVEWKGIDLLLSAAKVINKRVPDSRLLILGDARSDTEKKHLEELKDIATILEINNHVIWGGFRKNVLSFIKSLDVLVNSSIEPEPLGRSVLEAMALKTPVVSFNHGGSVEQIIDSKTGFLTPVGDGLSMANAIIAILQNHDLKEKFSINSHQRYLENFTAKQHTKGVQTIYEGVLKNV